MANNQADPIRVDDFAGFMRAYQDMVFSTAARLTGNDAQAEDIAQEVFLRAYEHFHQLRASPAAGGWLKTVARNLTLNYLSRCRQRWRLFSELQTADDGEEPGDWDFAAPEELLPALDAKQRGALIDEALKSLPPQQRVPLVLYHFENMSYEHIATTLEVSLAKVKTDILRARAALAKKLLRSGLSRAALRD
ncbi:MAG TPA: sigma-70 family RNA polymerase sigma factor [Steroidobacter sp.]|nr:sigma-70 family RNA polymerase sigma factor [Steroidobacter sp.]